MAPDFYHCKRCGAERTQDRPLDETFLLCPACLKERNRAYDDYVDPLHWYHQHNPDRATEY